MLQLYEFFRLITDILLLKLNQLRLFERWSRFDKTKKPPSQVAFLNNQVND